MAIARTLSMRPRKINDHMNVSIGVIDISLGLIGS